MAGRGPFVQDDDLMYAHPDELMGRALGSDVALGNNITDGEYGGIPTQEAIRMGVAPAGTRGAANAPTPSATAVKPAPQPGADAINPAVSAPAPAVAPAGIPAVPAPPTRDNTRMTQLEAQRDKLNVPTDPKSVRPSLWRQILGYASAAAGGYASQMGRHPYETDIGERIGKSLWKDPLDRAEKQRTGQLDEVNKAINQENQKYHDAMDAFSATVTGYRAQTEARQAAATEQLHVDQLNEKKGEITKQWVAEDPNDIDPKTGKGRLHQYEVDKGGKTYNRGPAPKDQQLEETKRHNRADEANARDRNALDREKTTNSKRDLALAQVEKDKETAYQKLEKETQMGLDKAAANPNGYGEPLPVNDPGRKAREQAIYDGKAAQAKMIEDGYNARRAQLGATPGTAAQTTPAGSKTSQVTGELHSSVTETRVDKSPSGQPRQGERVEVVDKRGKRFTVPASQVAQAEAQGYKRAAGKK